MSLQVSCDSVTLCIHSFIHSFNYLTGLLVFTSSEQQRERERERERDVVLCIHVCVGVHNDTGHTHEQIDHEVEQNKSYHNPVIWRSRLLKNMSDYTKMLVYWDAPHSAANRLCAFVLNYYQGTNTTKGSTDLIT